MNNITTTNPEEFLGNTKGNLFQIYLVTPEYTLVYAQGGFQNVEAPAGFQTSQVYNRNELVESYYEASRNAKESFEEGSLSITELPAFERK